MRSRPGLPYRVETAAARWTEWWAFQTCQPQQRVLKGSRSSLGSHSNLCRDGPGRIKLGQGSGGGRRGGVSCKRGYILMKVSKRNDASNLGRKGTAHSVATWRAKVCKGEMKGKGGKERKHAETCSPANGRVQGWAAQAGTAGFVIVKVGSSSVKRRCRNGDVM